MGRIAAGTVLVAVTGATGAETRDPIAASDNDGSAKGALLGIDRGGNQFGAPNLNGDMLNAFAEFSTPLSTCAHTRSAEAGRRLGSRDLGAGGAATAGRRPRCRPCRPARR